MAGDSLVGERLAHSQVVFYIDNESARMAYIRGDGATDLGAKIVEQFVSLEAKMQLRVWFGRVPSHSNPADSPNRLEFGEVSAAGAVQTNICWERIEEHLES